MTGTSRMVLSAQGLKQNMTVNLIEITALNHNSSINKGLVTLTTGQRCQGNNQPTNKEKIVPQITYSFYLLGDAPKIIVSISTYFLIFLILNLNWLLFFFEEHSCTSECIFIFLKKSRYLRISYIFQMLSSLLNNSSKKNFAEDIIKMNWWHLPPIFCGEKQLILSNVHLTCH